MMRNPFILSCLFVAPISDEEIFFSASIAEIQSFKTNVRLIGNMRSFWLKRAHVSIKTCARFN